MANRYSALIISDNDEKVTSSKSDKKYTNPLNKALRIFFKEAVRVSVKNPTQAYYFFQVVRNQQRSSRIRAKWAEEGVHVPPIIIFSITNRCNLHCKGCYHQALRDISKAELSEEKLRNIIGEARDLGVSFMVLAGGEPLVRRDIMGIMQDFPDTIFLMFTNGLLINDEMVSRFKARRNIVPLISLEGYEQDTNERRGSGVYESLQGVIEKLKRQDVFFGTSLTLTRQNFDTITNDEFVGNLTRLGCKLLLFAEYTPVKDGTEDWVITQEQRDRLAEIMNSFRAKYSSLFVSVPGDEKDFGGCLSAGRGFVHISAEGDLEPCPFAPYSDVNLKDKSLKEALQSKFLRSIRDNDQLGKETGGSCALFAQRQWVQSQLKRDAD